MLCMNLGKAFKDLATHGQSAQTNGRLLCECYEEKARGIQAAGALERPEVMLTSREPCRACTVSRQAHPLDCFHSEFRWTSKDL